MSSTPSPRCPRSPPCSRASAPRRVSNVPTGSGTPARSRRMRSPQRCTVHVTVEATASSCARTLSSFLASSNKGVPCTLPPLDQPPVHLPAPPPLVLCSSPATRPVRSPCIHIRLPARPARPLALCSAPAPATVRMPLGPCHSRCTVERLFILLFDATKPNRIVPN